MLLWAVSERRPAGWHTVGGTTIAMDADNTFLPHSHMNTHNTDFTVHHPLKQSLADKYAFNAGKTAHLG